VKGSITILASQTKTLVNLREEDVLEETLGGVVQRRHRRVKVVVASAAAPFLKP